MDCTNKTLVQMLCSLLVDGHQQKWVSYLPYVEFGINAILNVSVGCSPFELIYGVCPWLPIRFALGMPDTSHSASLEFD